MILLSLAIGVISAIAAYLLKNAVHYTHHYVSHAFHNSAFNWGYLIFPIIGITITVLFIKLFVKDNIGHGVARILYSIARKQGRIKPHNMWSSIVTSAITIGFGGSVGAEAPIVLTGSAIGSNVGTLLRLNHKSMIILIGCGAAAAIAGIFKAPIAGVIFTMEVLMLDLTMASLIPLLISAVTAASLSHVLLGNDVLFHFPTSNAFDLHNIPWVILLGVASGFVSLHFTRSVYWVENKLESLGTWYTRLAFGGIILSILIFLFPSLYGEGYDTISDLINGNTASVVENTLVSKWHDLHYVLLLYLLAVMLFKVFATSITTGAGGVGGIFAPSLFMGGVTGFWLGRFLNGFGLNINESNFVLVGMAGVMSGVLHAPLTAIFLIAEITNGYNLFLPLMMTSVISYLTIMLFEKHSLYHKRLATSGELLTHHKDKNVLTLMRLQSVIEKDFDPVRPEYTLGELVKVISKSKRNLFPVLDKNEKLIGIVLLDDIRNLMFRPEKYEEFTVERLMSRAPGSVCISKSMDDVMHEFERTNAWNLPVLDEEGRYIGFVSKSKIFNAYRKVLVHYSDE